MLSNMENQQDITYSHSHNSSFGTKNKTGFNDSGHFYLNTRLRNSLKSDLDDRLELDLGNRIESGLYDSDNEYPYKGFSGTRYKYDLSKPVDRIKYQIDPFSQVRDSIKPMVDIDRDFGQFGGGAK